MDELNFDEVLKKVVEDAFNLVDLVYKWLTSEEVVNLAKEIKMIQEEEQLRILKKRIMSDEPITQDELKDLVKTLEQEDIITRPQVRKEVETR